MKDTFLFIRSSNIGTMSGLSESETTRAKAIFKLMDTDASGTVTIDEICSVHDSDKAEMMKMIDTDGDGKLRL